MIKRILQHFRNRKEQKLRKELLLSAGEDERVKNWIGLLGIQSRQSNAPSDKG